MPFCLPASNAEARNIELLRVPLAACLSRNSFEKPCENDHVFSCFSFLLRTSPFSLCSSLSLIHKPCPDICFGSKLDVSVMSKMNCQQSRVLARSLVACIVIYWTVATQDPQRVLSQWETDRLQFGFRLIVIVFVFILLWCVLCKHGFWYAYYARR